MKRSVHVWQRKNDIKTTVILTEDYKKRYTGGCFMVVAGVYKYR